MKAEFENGSTRSEKKPPYHLVPFEANLAIAERMGLGWEHHGEENWKRGGPAFFAETKNHAAEHWLKYLAGDATDQHLDATITNLAMLAWWERTGRAAWERKQP